MIICKNLECTKEIIPIRQDHIYCSKQCRDKGFRILNPNYIKDARANGKYKFDNNTYKIRRTKYMSNPDNMIKLNARRAAWFKFKEVQSCSISRCTAKGERHHPDYNQPSDIIWLCKKHHVMAHSKQCTIEQCNNKHLALGFCSMHYKRYRKGVLNNYSLPVGSIFNNYYISMNKDKGYIYHKQNMLFGSKEIIGFGDNDWYVKQIPKKTSKQIIIKNHYSKKVCNDATTHIHLGVFIGGNLLGVLQFGYAMNPLSASKIVRGTKINEYKELNRMWLCDSVPRNGESKSISYAIKYIKGKYPKVKWIQTFADERCNGLGIMYQACSFGYYGSHNSKFWYFKDEIYHNSHITNNNRNKKAQLENQGFFETAKSFEFRQFRYIKFLDNRYKKKCTLKELPYLKHYQSD